MTNFKGEFSTKKRLLFTIPVLILAIVMVTTAHAWLATALCQRFGNASDGSNTTSANAGSYGLQYGYTYAYAFVDESSSERRSFYTNTVSASAYDGGDYSDSGDAEANVHGWNPSLNTYSNMRRTHAN